jgi:DNA repair exonuclease SbcCD ATPase subunit
LNPRRGAISPIAVMLRIAHLADIHIQDRRRAEYAAVFARLYESLRAEAPGLIVLAGDIFDNKMRASPHNLADVAAFLAALAAVAPLVVIAGNHDTNCMTPGALDLLTPLVAEHRALQPPRLTYWRRSGVYAAHGLLWTVIATDGERPSEAAERDVAAAAGLEAAPHLCLFHEEVNGALLPNGQQMRDYKLSAGSFGRYDLALGGHIHLRQRFAPRAAYCGSLVQQNIGEAHHGHGYVLWEVEPSGAHAPHRTAPPRMRGVDIPNDHGFVRVEVDAAGRDVTARPLPGAPLYWELAHDEDAPPAPVAALATEYEALYGMPPRAVRPRPRAGALAPAPAEAPATTASAERLALVEAQAASRALAAHEEIIRELLAGDEGVEAVLALHRARWREPASQAAGGRFRILRLEFDNLYAFGPANVVDFTALEGAVSGVVAPNHSGKSSLIEALLFALYEEHPRAPSKKDVIHRGAGSCRLALDFELDGKPGRIAKGFDHGSRNAASQYRFEYAGEDRTGGGTTDTLAEIEAVLGGAANALASSFQLQGGEAGGFIGSNPAGRKKLIASVMALGSFEGIERATAKELVACGGEVKALEAQYRGVDGEKLFELLCKEEGDLDDCRAAVGGLSAAAAAAGRAAEASGHELGVALGEDRGIQAAAVAALDAAAAAEGAPPPRACEESAAAWAALAGELAPAEESAAPRRRAAPGEEHEAAALADVEAARAALRAAQEEAREKTRLLHAAELSLASVARPEGELASARERAAAAEEASVRAEALPPFDAGRDLRPPPAQPAVPRGAGGPGAAPRGGQRSGERPDAGAITAAATAVSDCGAVAPADRAAAAAWDPSELRRLEAALAAAGEELAAELALAEEPEPPAPSHPRRVGGPAAGAGADFGERRGGRPTPSAVGAAHETLAEHPAPGLADRAEAARWDPVELARLEGALAAIPPGGLKPLNEAEADLAEASRQLTEAAAAVGALGPEAPAAAVEYPALGGAPSPGGLASAAAALRSAQDWVAAVTHASTIASKLRPEAGCPGCEHALALVGQAAAENARGALAGAVQGHRIALAGTYHEALAAKTAARLTVVRAEAACAAAAAAERKAVAVGVAQKKVAALVAAGAQHRRAAAVDAAVAVLETANYWAARDADAWERYDAARAAWEDARGRRAERRLRAARDMAEAQTRIAALAEARVQHRRAAAVDAAVAVLETANYWAARDADAWGRYDAALTDWASERAAVEASHEATRAAERARASLARAAATAHLAAAVAASERHDAAAAVVTGAGAQRAAAEASLAAAGARLQRVAAARSEAVSALLWWRRAAAAAAASEGLRRAAAAAAEAARASAERVAAARVAAAAASLALEDARARLASAQKHELASERDIARLRLELAHESARAAQYRVAASRRAALKAYRAVLRPSGGIGDRLLERGRAALTRQIDGALRELGARFTAEITPEYDVRLRPREGAADWLPASLGSGYQKFVLSLAARLAIWRLSSSPRPDAFVIDEGFGACDEDYLEAMASALEALASAPGGPRLVFLVSHVDALKARLERALEIVVHGAGSRVANAAPRPAPRPAPRDEKAARPEKKAKRAGAVAAGASAAEVPAPAPETAALGPDPENSSNVYCGVCRQSLRAAWASKHLSSAKHAQAALKRGRPRPLISRERKMKPPRPE